MHYCLTVETAKFLYEIGVSTWNVQWNDRAGPIHTLNQFGTPLSVALYWLDQKEADLWSKDQNGNLPIFNLVMNQKHDELTMGPIFYKMKELMGNQKEKLLKHRNKDSLSLLEYAISSGSIFSIRLVLKHYPELLTAKVTNDDQYNLVHLLAYRINSDDIVNGICTETIQLLKKTDEKFFSSLVKGKDVLNAEPIEVVLRNIMDSDDNGPFEKDLSFVELLLWEGASISTIHRCMKADLETRINKDTMPNYVLPVVKFLCLYKEEPKETFFMKKKRLLQIEVEGPQDKKLKTK